MTLSQLFYWLIIAFMVADFAIGLWLTALNIKASKWPIPKVLEGLYDDEKYRKQQAYASENRRVGFIISAIGVVFSVCFFAFGGFAWLDGVVRGMSGSDVVRTLLFFGFFFVLEFLMGLPFEIYKTFSIEERYGFNKTTPKLFAGDTVKSFILNIILNGGLLALFVWFYILSPNWFWLIGFAGFTAVSLFFTYFYSEIIVPLFNKQTPLEEGELRSAIEAFARTAGFELENIYVMDESKRTTKANAYFTGLGKKKRVVLFDTLIQQLTTDEIVGVLAHEIGHYKKKHIIKDMSRMFLESFVMFFLVYLVIGNPDVAAAAGCVEPSFWVNVQVLGMLLTPLGLVQGLIDNSLSRKHEREADRFAFDHGGGAHEASALKKMCSQALDNLTPHPLVVRFEYSHPTLAERVTTLQKPAFRVWKGNRLEVGDDVVLPEGFMKDMKPSTGDSSLSWAAKQSEKK